MDHPEMKTLPPGQQAILRSFAKHGADSCYVASDIMDLRVCSAMTAGGLLRRATDVECGYDLTHRGALIAGFSPEAVAPGHTDLMVTPESLDAFMEANPLPPE